MAAVRARRPDRCRRRARRRVRVRDAPGARCRRGRALLARARRARWRRSASTARAGSSTSGPSAPRRCSPGPRSSTSSCSRTAARSSARRSRTRTARSTGSRSSRRCPRREAEVAAEHGCPVCAALRDELADGTRVVRDDAGWVDLRPVRVGVSLRRDARAARARRRACPRSATRHATGSRPRSSTSSARYDRAVRPRDAVPHVGAPRRARARPLRAAAALGGHAALRRLGRGRQRDVRQPGRARSRGRGAARGGRAVADEGSGREPRVPRRQ